MLRVLIFRAASGILVPFLYGTVWSLYRALSKMASDLCMQVPWNFM
jgi:hypothetical protein